MSANLLTVALMALIVGAGGGYWKGHADGTLQETAAHDSQAVTDLTALIDSNRQLVKSANTASVRLTGIMADRAAYDWKTSKTLKEVLDETAATRRGCVFGDRVMLELENARLRAARAAAGGFDDAGTGTGGASE